MSTKYVTIQLAVATLTSASAFVEAGGCNSFIFLKKIGGLYPTFHSINKDVESLHGTY